MGKWLAVQDAGLPPEGCLVVMAFFCDTSHTELLVRGYLNECGTVLTKDLDPISTERFEMRFWSFEEKQDEVDFRASYRVTQ